MKKTTTFATLAAMAALATLSLTGCNSSDNSYSTTFPLVGTIEAVTGSETRITSFEYDDRGSTSREIQTVGGKTVYEINDFKYVDVVSRVRTTYNEDGTTTRHRLETSYTTEGAFRTELLRMFLLTGEEADPAMPTDVYELTYYIDTKYSHLYRHTNNMGQTVLERSGYDYSYISTATPYYTYLEKADDITRRMRYEYTDGTGKNYELYSAAENDLVGKGEKVESVTGYQFNNDTLKETYTFTDYRGDVPVVTSITITYFNKTVTI
jgi:hypothetical protein